MRVLDLFSGLEGWSLPFRAAGHEVITLDVDPMFAPDIVMDIRRFARSGWRDLLWIPDVVLASPPCHAFSVASIGHHWKGGKRAYIPKTEEAEESIELVRATVRVIDKLAKEGLDRWWIENPRDVLRNLDLIPYERCTVWLCHYEDHRAKPTDLWGSFGDWQSRPLCHNRRDGHKRGCCCHDHEQARRGAKTGTQGVDGAAERAKIPWGLAADVMASLEAEQADM